MPQVQRQILEEDETSITYREGGKTYTEMKPGAGLAAMEAAEKADVARKKPEDFSKLILGALAKVGLPAAAGFAAGGPPGALVGAAGGLADVAINPRFSGGSVGANVMQAALSPQAKLASRLLLPAAGAALGETAQTGSPGRGALAGGVTAAGGAFGEGLPFLAGAPMWIKRGVQKVQGEIDDLFRGTTRGVQVPDKEGMMDLLRRAGQALPEAPKEVPVPPAPKVPGAPPKEPIPPREIGAPPKEPQIPVKGLPPKGPGSPPAEPLTASKEKWDKYRVDKVSFDTKNARYQEELATHNANYQEQVSAVRGKYQEKLDSWNAKRAERDAAYAKKQEEYTTEAARYEKAKANFDELLARREAAKEAPLWQNKMYMQRMQEWADERGITQDELMGLVKSFNERGKLAGSPEALLKNPSMLAGTLKSLEPKDQAKLIASYLDDAAKSPGVRVMNEKTKEYVTNTAGFVQRLDEDAAVVAAMPPNWRQAVEDFKAAVTAQPNPAATLKNPVPWIVHRALVTGGSGRGASGLAGMALAERIIPNLLNTDIRRLAEKGTDPLAQLLMGGAGRDVGLATSDAMFPPR